jgi:hypothetical protein
MANPISRSRVSLLVCAVACVSVAHAQDARISVFERYNRATTYNDIKSILSGVLAQQYASIAGQDPQRLPQILAQQQLTSYRPRIVEIDDVTSFLVLENVTSKSSRDTKPQAYLMSRGSDAAWTLANRVLPESVLKTLWTTRFTPADFTQASSCAIDGRAISTQSALAVRERDTIQITLYPFMFSESDLAYWRQVSGMPVNEAAVAGSHFSEARPPVCRLVVRIDGANQLSLLNVGFDDRTGSFGRSTLWQPAKADVSRLALERDTIAVVTAGALGTDTSGFWWNVKIKVPIWQKGL